MPRFYVKNKENKWNIYSTIIDDLIFEEWIEFVDLEKYVCKRAYKEKQAEIQTLLTDKPILNIMSYEECMKYLKESAKDD